MALQTWWQNYKYNSLKVRLILSALFVTFILLPIVGLALNDAFRFHVKNAAKNELSAYIYSVLAVTEVKDNQLQMPEVLLENQFNVIQSGLYALISAPTTHAMQNHPPKILWRSASMLGLPSPNKLPQPDKGQNIFSEITLDGHPFLIYSYSATFESSLNTQNKDTSTQAQRLRFPITLHIIKDKAEFELQVHHFSQQLWLWLMILMLILAAVQFAWLWWTLKPLTSFKLQLADVEQGKLAQLSTSYPAELREVATALNLLLLTEQNQRKRYRNSLADLAHSLKTPLAVIQSQVNLDEVTNEQIIQINHIINHQLNRAKTSKAAWYSGVDLIKVIEKLVRTLGKIYQAPAITISKAIATDAIFIGDEADITEILGNLLDNACKAAHSQVHISVTSQPALTIIIEDDGKGLNEQQSDIIFERGIRADTYSHGHGIGLAIVQDLVNSYQGSLQVGKSTLLGGAMFTLTFHQLTKSY